MRSSTLDGSSYCRGIVSYTADEDQVIADLNDIGVIDAEWWCNYGTIHTAIVDRRIFRCRCGQHETSKSIFVVPFSKSLRLDLQKFCGYLRVAVKRDTVIASERVGVSHGTVVPC